MGSLRKVNLILVLTSLLFALLVLGFFALPGAIIIGIVAAYPTFAVYRDEILSPYHKNYEVIGECDHKFIGAGLLNKGHEFVFTVVLYQHPTTGKRYYSVIGQKDVPEVVQRELEATYYRWRDHNGPVPSRVNKFIVDKTIDM